MPQGNGVDWDDLIAAACAARDVERTAKRFDGGLPSASKPQKFICDDQLLYAVKFAQNAHGDGHGIFSEQLVGRAGRLIGAPVPEVALVEVSAALAAEVAQDPQLGFVPQAGVHHASKWADNHTDRQTVDHIDSNRERFGALDVLYAWIFCAGDHQFIYSNEPTRDVLSVDHSAFLPSGPDWTVQSVAGGAQAVQQDQVFAALALGSADRASAVQQLRRVMPEAIAKLVSYAPDEWGVDLVAREAVASYLWFRRDQVIQLFGVGEAA
jgi:hypothetical protein